MPDDKISKSSPQPQKKKKKKKKKQKADSTSPKDADQLHTTASAPPVFPTMGPSRPLLPKVKSSPKKDSEKGSRKSKKSSVSLLSLVCKSGESPVQSFLSQLSVQARESVRWEGELNDPLDEELRLERYRANRRLRYFRHRETQLKELEQENKYESAKYDANARVTNPN